MNTREKNAIIEASRAIDGRTPDKAILIRIISDGDETKICFKSYDINVIYGIMAGTEWLKSVVETYEDDNDQNVAKRFIISTLQSVFEGEYNWGAVTG